MRDRALSPRRLRLLSSGRVALLALLALPSIARAARLDCGTATAVPGGVAVVEVTLGTDNDEAVNGTQNDLEFDDDLFDASRPDAPDRPDCRINPAIGPGSPVAKMLASSLLASPSRVRAFILALGNLLPIPSGLLYTCNFRVAADTPLGEYRFANLNLGVAPRGPVEGTDCVINVVAPTPTPTPIPCERDEDCPSGEVCVEQECIVATPTPTPTGCDDDEDCPTGEVCAGDRCVTPTPTPVGFCVDGDDCPTGQVCVDNRCATPTVTVTPTPEGFCVDLDDCPQGQICVNDRCATLTPTQSTTPTPEGFCVLNDDCPQGQICVNGRCATVTPTSRATVTRTPEGFCAGNDDCPDGEICIGNACATPTATVRALTATPIGFCQGDDDCSDGQVCANNACVTPTPKKGGGDGCHIEAARSDGGGDGLLAWLVPAVFFLRRRRHARA